MLARQGAWVRSGGLQQGAMSRMACCNAGAGVASLGALVGAVGACEGVRLHLERCPQSEGGRRAGERVVPPARYLRSPVPSCHGVVAAACGACEQ